MINGNVSDFVDNLYYGTEMYFVFKDKKYFIQGWVKDSLHYLVLDFDYETENYDSNNPNCNKYLWEYTSADSQECVDAFLNAPLWNGKTFYEVEDSIVWSDP